MFKVKNISFDKIIAKNKLKVSSIDELSEDELVDLILNDSDINSPVIYFEEKDPLTGEKKRGGVDMNGTIKALTKSQTFSAYMDTSYWQKAHQEKAAAGRVLKKLQQATIGDDVYDTLAGARLGFYNLKPGEEVTIDVATRWVSDYLKKQPMASYLAIVNLDAQEPEAPVSAKSSVVDLNEKEFSELRKIAKEYDLPADGNREQLIERISKVL